MKPRSQILIAGMLLAISGEGFAQPTINTQPQSCTNFVGSTVTFHVGVGGVEPFAYQWQKRDYLLNITDMTNCTAATLMLTNVQSTDALDYRVVVTNRSGSAISSFAHLTVIPPPTIAQRPFYQAVAPGETATFTVVASGTGPFTYQWQRNIGAGFVNLDNRTDASLVLSSAQVWDAWDYRVIVANPSGARISASAHLYVMSPGLLTKRAVVDNFNSPSLARWIWGGSGTQFPLLETNGQFILRGKWPGIRTLGQADTWDWPYVLTNWACAQNRTTIECHLDLVSMSENATNMAGFMLWSDNAGEFYGIVKNHDFVEVTKWIGSGSAVFSHDQQRVKNSNVVLALALTRVDPNVVVTAKVLDKDNEGAVLFQRIVVDTALADPNGP